jgi:hypothetical protein
MENELLRFDKSKKLVFIDCETLNLCLNFCQNLPWQIAMLSTVGGKKVDERDFLVKWDTNLKISEDARRITRYPEELIRTTGKKFDDVFSTVRDWLECSDYIVGHNILGFDLYLIKEMYLLKGMRASHLVNKILDTNCLAKGIKYGIPKMPKESLVEYQYKLLHTYRKGIKTNLTSLGKDYNIEHDYENLHNAIVDLELNLKVWNKIKFQVEI